LNAPLHATLAAYRDAAGWRGVLFRGASGAGKSHLALSLIGRGWRLVADDRVVAWSSGGRAFGRAPDVLRGLLEVRTVGVLSFPALGLAEIVHVVDCVDADSPLERIPLPAWAEISGVALPLCRIDARWSGAPETVEAFCRVHRL